MASVFKAGTAAGEKKGKRKAVDADAADASASASASASTSAGPLRRNKQRTLILPSRGVTMRMRHLVNDIESLLPHSKKDSKLDSKSDLHVLNELAELNNCNNTLYFEARKHTDLYMWASKTPNGPSAKLHVQNIHTMDELKMTGNCLKGSRHLLSFDKAFDDVPHWGIMKELLGQAFGVPRTARRSKPFIDHVLTFSILDGKIWFRNYQIVAAKTDPGASALAAAAAAAQEKAGGRVAKGRASAGKKGEEKPPTLVEIGPRFVLTPIRLFEGSFGGATLYENPSYVSPNTIRHDERAKKGQKYKEKTTAALTFEAKRRRLEEERTPDELARDRVFA